MTRRLKILGMPGGIDLDATLELIENQKKLAVSGSGRSVTLTGDVTGTGSGTVATTIAAGVVGSTEIGDAAVTYDKIQNVSAASKLLGRGNSGAGDVQELALGSNLSMSGTTLNATGDAWDFDEGSSSTTYGVGTIDLEEGASV